MERIFANQTLAMSLGAVGAYNVIYSIRCRYAKKILWKRLIRDGRLVATSSVLTGQANYPWVIAKLKTQSKNSRDLGDRRYNYSFL